MERFRSNRPFSKELIDKIDHVDLYKHAWRRSCMFHHLMYNKDYLTKEQIVNLAFEYVKEFPYSGLWKDIDDFEYIMNLSICAGLMTKCDQ
jgi:hypothetical protein